MCLGVLPACSAFGGQKKALCSLELELQVTVIGHVGVCSEPLSSGRAPVLLTEELSPVPRNESYHSLKMG